MKQLLIIALLFSLAMGCSQNTNREISQYKEGGESVKLNISSPDNNFSGSASNLKVTKSTELLPAISEKYQGVELLVTNLKDKSKTKYVVPFNQETIISKDGSVGVIISSYFTNFVLADGGVVNKSMEELNPAATISVTKDKNNVYKGWLFQNFPDVHEFKDPDWNIILIRGVPKTEVKK